MTSVKKLSLFRQFSEFRKLIMLSLLVKGRNFLEFLRVIFRYYRNLSFAKTDLTLLLQYLLKSPFHYSKKFLEKKKVVNIYAYGETPLTTLDLIASQAKVGKEDIVFELGCGRGRTCFWLNEQLGCEVVGVDIVPAFIQKAEWVRALYSLDQLSFICEDFRDVDLSTATVLYLYGTCYGDQFLHQLVERFRELPTGTRIITVSYPLTDYTTESLFEVMNIFSAPFTWGEADVYIQYRL